MTIISLILTLVFLIYKKKGRFVRSLQWILISCFIFCFIFLIEALPFFIEIENQNPIKFIEINLRSIIVFNVSIGLVVICLILFSSSFLKEIKGAVFLNGPSRRDSKNGSIEIGRVMEGNTRTHKFFLAKKDLEKHMFICGATGTGKSNFLQNFLINFSKKYDIPFFLVEFKGEYHFLQDKIKNVIVLWPGVNFSINIFNPGNDSSAVIHAERIFDILKSGQFLDENSEFSPQMEKVLIDILSQVCGDRNNQNWEGFEKYCTVYLRKNKNDIPMLNQTLISIKNRIRRFSKGPLSVLFDKENQLNLHEIFTKNVILDLSSIIRLGGEKEDAFFFLNMILKYLWDKNLTKGAFDYSGIAHISIIEDAQYFAPQDVMKKSKITSYLEDIALLQRGTGECLITLATRPNISKEILANNGVVITFKNHIEKEIMRELLNLEEDGKSYVSMLEEGQAIIRTNSIKYPFIISVPLINRRSLSISEIDEKNHNILNLNISSSPMENNSIINEQDEKIENSRTEQKTIKELGDLIENILNGK